MRNEKRHITISLTAPSEELYRFGANGNLQAYMYENLLYVHYGYNDANTRTYKYSMDLSPNWVNGRLEAVNFNPHTAMFYPNSYLNFNQDGHYTKHYYNGMERIASRLGDNNLSLSTHDPELQDRKEWQDSLIRKNITEITGYEFLPVGEEQNPEDPKPVFELPQVGITGLQPSADGTEPLLCGCQFLDGLNLRIAGTNSGSHHLGKFRLGFNLSIAQVLIRR